jgi:PPOX class probable F420-dependent enzyme
MPLPDELLELLRAPSTCYIATLMKDGSPQVTQVWVDTDGENVIINTVDSHVKTHNLRRDPRVAVVVSSPQHPGRYFQIRGRASLSYENAVDHIERLSEKYTGGPYPWYGGRDQIRVIVTVEPRKVSAFGGR